MAHFGGPRGIPSVQVSLSLVLSGLGPEFCTPIAVFGGELAGLDAPYVNS